MRRSRFLTFLTNLLLGTSVASHAATVLVPPPAIRDNAWATARKEFDQGHLMDDATQLEAWLRAELARRPLYAVVDASYRIEGVDRDLLDRLWLGIAEERQHPALLARVTQARAAIGAGPATRQEFLDQWLVQVNGNGCYSSCGNGNGGNGTGNEGGKKN